MWLSRYPASFGVRLEKENKNRQLLSLDLWHGRVSVYAV